MQFLLSHILIGFNVLILSCFIGRASGWLFGLERYQFNLWFVPLLGGFMRLDIGCFDELYKHSIHSLRKFLNIFAEVKSLLVNELQSIFWNLGSFWFFLLEIRIIFLHLLFEFFIFFQGLSVPLNVSIDLVFNVFALMKEFLQNYCNLIDT